MSLFSKKGSIVGVRRFSPVTTLKSADVTSHSIDLPRHARLPCVLVEWKPNSRQRVQTVTTSSYLTDHLALDFNTFSDTQKRSFEYGRHC